MAEGIFLPAGFLGTRGDILMDVVILAFMLILPSLIYSWGQARKKQYATHKRWQLIIFTLLAVAVSLFEADMMMAGGIFVLTAESSYSGTSFFNTLMYSHTALAISSSLIWVCLVAASLWKFDNPPSPNQFSKTHRRWGRVGMILMMLAGLSSLPVYYFGFAV
jgi:putative membrane protein